MSKHDDSVTRHDFDYAMRLCQLGHRVARDWWSDTEDGMYLWCPKAKEGDDTVFLCVAGNEQHKHHWYARPSDLIGTDWVDLDEGKPYAREVESTTAVHGDLRAQPEQGEQKVPLKEGGKGIRQHKNKGLAEA